MTANEAAIRKAYQVAEDKDLSGWVNCFTEDGTFTDESIGVTYRVKLIKSFNCYPYGTVVLTQLGVLQQLEPVLAR